MMEDLIAFRSQPLDVRIERVSEIISDVLADYLENSIPLGKRSVVALAVLAALLDAEKIYPEQIQEHGEDSGRVLNYLRNVLDVPVTTHFPRSAHAFYAMRPEQIAAFFNPDQRPKQARLQRALMARHKKRRAACATRSLHRQLNVPLPDWIAAIAAESLPPVIAGSVELEGADHE